MCEVLDRAEERGREKERVNTERERARADAAEANAQDERARADAAEEKLRILEAKFQQIVQLAG